MFARTAFVFAFLIASAIQADERPNILWVIADDLRPQLGCYGNDVVKSPHIDQFSKQALRFEHAYVQSAVCSPSRNSFLSGLRPNTTGLRGFGVKIRDVVPDIVTLPQHFKNHGYDSRAFGKIYHIYDNQCSVTKTIPSRGANLLVGQKSQSGALNKTNSAIN